MFYLAPDGLAIVRTDLPVTAKGCPFVRELEDISSLTGAKVRIIVKERIDVRAQSRSSAETAAFLNQQIDLGELAEQFETNYQVHGFEWLWRGFIEIEHGPGNAVEVADETMASSRTTVS